MMDDYRKAGFQNRMSYDAYCTITDRHGHLLSEEQEQVLRRWFIDQDDASVLWDQIFGPACDRLERWAIEDGCLPEAVLV